MSPSQIGYGGWTNASCRTYAPLSCCDGFSLKLIHRHRTGGYNCATYLHASPLLVMLPFPKRFPSQSQTLCPERYALPTFPCYAGIRLAVRRRTWTSFERGRGTCSLVGSKGWSGSRRASIVCGWHPPPYSYFEYSVSLRCAPACQAEVNGLAQVLLVSNTPVAR